MKITNELQLNHLGHLGRLWRNGIDDIQREIAFGNADARDRGWARSGPMRRPHPPVYGDPLVPVAGDQVPGHVVEHVVLP